jgi:prepilin peptidase CpaA
MQFTMLSVPQYVAGALVLIACIPDLRTRRIPNVLTLGAALVGLAFHAFDSGWSGLASSAGGWTLGVALFLPMFALRGMGAGDVKLLAAVGAWLGPAQVLWVALLTSVAGGVLGLAVALLHGYLSKMMSNLHLLLTSWWISGLRPIPQMTLADHRGPRLAYAVPIAVGTMVTLWLK